jgi:hypothetical protein
VGTTQASITTKRDAYFTAVTEHPMKPTMRVIHQSFQKQSVRLRKATRSPYAVRFTRDDLISLLPWIVAILIAMALGTWLGLTFPGDIISD